VAADEESTSVELSVLVEKADEMVSDSDSDTLTDALERATEGVSVVKLEGSVDDPDSLVD